MATCKDCLHYDVCKKLSGYTEEFITSCEKNFEKYGDAKEKCECFKDRSKFVELPCKVGDLVYLVLKGVTDVLIGNVRRMSFNHKNELVICIGRQKGRYYTTGNHKISSFGKSVFLTKQEAEQALAERSGE